MRLEKERAALGGVFLKNPELIEWLVPEVTSGEQSERRPWLLAEGPEDKSGLLLGLPGPGGRRPQALRTGQRQRGFI